jgi:ring-1,2-phenylacetyl-CoA epoxidase subunit PaaB
MTAPQWPIYQVFERPAGGRPMRAGGSVHAVDAETALQNAWAVYGRRPTAVGLWVVPRQQVLMKTKEEFSTLLSTVESAGRAEQDYCVFCRSHPKLVYEETEPIRAASAEQAMARALRQLEDCSGCWVFPASAITSSEPAAVECSYTPQGHKWFRDHKSFPVNAMLRDVREHSEENSDVE